MKKITFAKICFWTNMLLYPILGLSQTTINSFNFGSKINSNAHCNSLLSMPLIPQVDSLWCYAACTEMVLRWQEPSNSIRQCDIVSGLLGLNDCCKNTSCLTTEKHNNACGQRLPASFNTNWLAFIKRNGFANSTLTPISFDSIKKNLDNCQPVIALFNTGISADGPLNHAVVITGYLEEKERKGWWFFRRDVTVRKWFYVLNPLSICNGCKHLIQYDDTGRSPKFISHSSNRLYWPVNPINSQITTIILKP